MYIFVNTLYEYTTFRPTLALDNFTIPPGICVPANQRHEFQKSYVEMLAQTLQGGGGPWAGHGW